MENRILEAVNEINYEHFETFEEILDVYTYDECIRAFLEYEGIIGYDYLIKELYEMFYVLIPKTNDNLK